MGDVLVDRSVNISCCIQTSALLLNPFGTFRGYGAYVGINPYRVVEKDSSDQVLGQTIVELLFLSGSTGRVFSDAKKFLQESRDEETERVRKLFRLDEVGLSTSRLNRRFLTACVEQKHNQKSWVLQVLAFDSKRRTVSGTSDQIHRIKHSEGAIALGKAVRESMVLPRRAKQEN